MSVIRHPWLGVVLAAGTLVLAGCGGFPPVERTPTRTASPAPVPSPSVSPTPTPEPSFPPGMVAGRVTDPGAVAFAHREALVNRSYVVAFNETTRYANGSLRSRVVSTIRVSPDGPRQLRTVRVAGPEGRLPVFPNATRVAVYAEETEVYARGVNDTGTLRDDGTAVRYARLNWSVETRQLLSPLGETLLISDLFGSMELRVTRVRRDNATMNLVESGELTLPTLLVGAVSADEQARVENAILRALVDSRGLVHEYHLNYTLVRNGTVVHGTQSMRYQDFEATVVRRPAWYDEAVNTTENATGNPTGG